MIIENKITIEPITLFIIRIPLTSNFPRILSISHVKPYHHNNAPAGIQAKPTIISKGCPGCTKANCAKQAKLEEDGILLDTLVVKDGATTLTKNEDYITSFTDDGKVLVSLIEGSSHAGASTLTVKSTSIDPLAVKAKDIIGGYDAATDKESGLELIRQVYPRFNMTPGLLLAPGW